MSWPRGDHTQQAREAARRVDMFFAHGPAARAWAAGIGLDDGRLRDGRSSVEGQSAAPWPGLPWPRLTFAGRLRGDKAPDVLLEALALLPAPPAAYLVGDGPPRAHTTPGCRPPAPPRRSTPAPPPRSSPARPDPEGQAPHGLESSPFSPLSWSSRAAVLAETAAHRARHFTALMLAFRERSDR